MGLSPQGLLRSTCQWRASQVMLELCRYLGKEEDVIVKITNAKGIQAMLELKTDFKAKEKQSE